MSDKNLTQYQIKKKQAAAQNRLIKLRKRYDTLTEKEESAKHRLSKISAEREAVMQAISNENAWTQRLWQIKK